VVAPLLEARSAGLRIGHTTATPNLTLPPAYTQPVTLPHFPLPDSDEAWDDWVSASRTRNFLEGDPLLDWLHRFGADHGFTPDDELPTYDERTDMRAYVLHKGIAFEAAVVDLIREMLPTQHIADGPMDSRDLAKADATRAAIREGVPVIEQGVLFDPVHRTYGVADLLVRSDHLNTLVPDTLTDEEATLPSPALNSPWHYRVVDIKFRTLDLRKDGSAGSDLAHYMAQVWIYNEALARILGMTPSASFLLGRSWTQGTKGRGDSCFDRLARVDHHRTLNADGDLLSTSALAAVEWIRRLRREGAGWSPLPAPSVPELYPHARNSQDQPWHAAKSRIAAELAELTVLPGMNPQLRRDAHARGILRWTDPRASATTLGVTRSPDKTDAVLRVNRDAPELVVLPERITVADPAWRSSARAEFYVDFETVSNMADDFSRLPRIGGQPLIFQIGCGWLESGEWQFEQWTTKRLTETDEAAIIDAWLAFMEGHLAARGLSWTDARVYHWSAAEASFLVNAYNSARERHPERSWPEPPWFDLLTLLIRPEPVTVAGAFGFGLKAIASGMHRAGLIETTWTDGPTDGLGAMIGAWWCDEEAERTGVTLPEIELMHEIGTYNAVDCRSMAEVLAWLRGNR